MTTPRSLSQIGAEISDNWHPVHYTAAPYLNAMRHLTTIHDKYLLDSGKSIVLYFLANASTWKGDTARRIKAELRQMVK